MGRGYSVAYSKLNDIANAMASSSFIEGVVKAMEDRLQHFLLRLHIIQQSVNHGTEQEEYRILHVVSKVCVING